jgi:hypothetical protein
LARLLGGGGGDDLTSWPGCRVRPDGAVCRVRTRVPLCRARLLRFVEATHADLVALRRQLRAAHPDAGEVNSSNVGTFTFVFDRGHFAETVENPQTCIWGCKTVKLAGAKVSLLFNGGGGTRPSAANAPGELFTLRGVCIAIRSACAAYPGLHRRLRSSPSPGCESPRRHRAAS